MSAPGLFERDGAGFRPTDLARGPWDAAALHGGPVVALVGRALAAVEAPGPVQLARITLELQRPVPVAPLDVRCEVVRPGRKVQLVRASLVVRDGPEVASAVALLVRRAELPVPEELGLGWAGAAPPPAGTGAPLEDRWAWRGFHNAGVELRFVEGGFEQPGPALVWSRLRADVVAGEPVTPLERVLASADFGNGISSVLDFESWLFINPDLTVHLHRLPAGEWVGLRSRSWVAGTGVGMAETELFDERGPLGRAVQSLLIDRR